MEIKLSDHYTYKKIFRITISPILMMLFTSLYSVIDGLCISNFEGGDAFAGVNLIFPIIMIVGGIGFMFGAGGSALVSKLLGEKKDYRAREVFAGVTLFTFIVGVVCSIGGYFLVEPIARLMGRLTDGTTENMINEAIKYGRILIAGQFAFMIQNLFQSFFVVDEKPRLGFVFTLAAGLTNIALDLLFIGAFHWGVIGAAAATIIGYVVGGVGPIIYFIFNKKGLLYFVKPVPVWKEIGKSCTNGSSEFVNNISSSVVGIVYNIQLLRYYGQNGVSAYGVLMYSGFAFFAIFIGYCVGMAPVVGYHYGAGNKEELQSILSKSMKIIAVFGVAMLTLCQICAKPISGLFCSCNAELASLTEKAFRIYAIIFLTCGFSMFTSSFFTDLNNGLISAICSFLRTLVFQIGAVILLPIFFGKEGIWWAVVVAEVAALTLAIIFLLANGNKYGYFKEKNKKPQDKEPGEPLPENKQ